MDAANQPPYVVEASSSELVDCTPMEETVMNMEVHPLPVALRSKEITEQELDALCRIAEDPNARTGVLDWTPRPVTRRKREAVAS